MKKHTTEVGRLLGRDTLRLAELQAANVASNPAVAPGVMADTERLIAQRYIDPDGETARVRAAALSGDWFQQRERGNHGVCMDDVTPFDR